MLILGAEARLLERPGGDKATPSPSGARYPGHNLRHLQDDLRSLICVHYLRNLIEGVEDDEKSTIIKHSQKIIPDKFFHQLAVRSCLDVIDDEVAELLDWHIITTPLNLPGCFVVYLLFFRDFRLLWIDQGYAP